MTLFPRKRKEPTHKEQYEAATLAAAQLAAEASNKQATENMAPKPETLIEKLQRRRQFKLDLVRRLDAEIAEIDRNITFLERYPRNAEILETLGTRLKGMFPDTEPPPRIVERWPDLDASQREALKGMAAEK